MSISIEPIIEKSNLQGEPNAREFIETKLDENRRIELELRIKEVQTQQNPYKLISGSKIKQGLSSTTMGVGGLLSMMGPETARLVMMSGVGLELFKSTKEKIGDIIQQKRDYKKFEENRLTRIRELQEIPRESEDIAPILPSANVASGAAILSQQSGSEGFQSDVLAEMQKSNQLFAEFLDELRDQRFATVQEKTSGGADFSLLQRKKSKESDLQNLIEEKSGGIVDALMGTVSGLFAASITKRISGPILRRLSKFLPKGLLSSGSTLLKSASKKALAVAGATGLVAAAKRGIEPIAKSISATGARIASKIGIKGAAGVAGKTLAKKVPVLGAILGTGFAIDRAISGDYVGAGGEFLSGLASTIPGIGTGMSMAIDAGLIARDMGAESAAFGSEQIGSREGMIPPQELPAPNQTATRTSSRTGPMVQPMPLPVPSGTKGLLETLAHGEGTSDVRAQRMGFTSGYDISFAYGKYNPRGHKPISEMTIGEVKALQRNMIRNQASLGIPSIKRSSAIGKYQLIQSTLQEQQRKLGLSDSDVFSPEVQDLMGKSLLQRRGLNEFMQGRISSRTFQRNLAKEWASVEDPSSGKSFYGQSVGTPTERIQSAISGVSKVPTSTAPSPSVTSPTMSSLLSTVSNNNSNLQTQMAARQLQPNAIPMPISMGGGSAGGQSGPMPGPARPSIKPRSEEPYFYEMQKKALISSIV